METAENTNGAATKIDLQCRGTCTDEVVVVSFCG